MMHNMVSNMTPEQLAAMSKASGHELSPEQVRVLAVFVMWTLSPGTCSWCPDAALIVQAEIMASKMQNMSEQQVQQLLKAAGWLQRGVDLARRARDIILANRLLVLGLIMLLIAIIVRRMGFV
jgi:hypothetical protein